MICGVVLVKSVKIVFTLKQFDFSFLDETAVGRTCSTSEKSCWKRNGSNSFSYWIHTWVMCTTSEKGLGKQMETISEMRQALDM